MKILGIIILLGALVMLVGGGIAAGMMYNSAASDYACRKIESSQAKIDELKKAYEAAKGTSTEAVTQKALETELKSAQGWAASCEDAKSFYKTRTMIYSAVAVVGLIGVVLGLSLTALGFRKKKAAA